MTERQSVIAWLKTQKVREPMPGAEQDVNQVIDHIINQIESGAHRVVEQKRTRR